MLHRALKSMRRLLDYALRITLPWDIKLDLIESRLAQLETSLEQASAYARLALSDRVFIEQMFVQSHGYIPNLDAPRTFNEKLAWTKLHRHEPIYAGLSDKIRSKSH